MRVFKFGGASVKNAEGFRNVGKIISNYSENHPLAVIVSATGKTTNQLEEVVEAKFQAPEEALAKLRKIKDHHYQIARDLFKEVPQDLEVHIQEHFVEAEWILEELREMKYDYVYDQVVSIGELVSSRILTAWLQHEKTDVVWCDARDLIITNDTYREGRVQWDVTNQRIRQNLFPQLNEGHIVVTQGFIGSTTENNTTTLGREGSDYTAAILASALDANGMYIWKDVPGVLTADPDLFVNVTKLDRLSYREAIEMTYYGCKVIHPKTIQPLKLKNIPLFVKSFIQPGEEGTLISGAADLEYPPIVVLETKQALLHFASLDLSFIAEYHLAHLFELFDKFRIKVNMMRNSAISFSVCVNNDQSRILQLIQEIESMFKVVVDQDLELLTVRHYQESMLAKLLEEKVVLLEERTRNTVQLVVKQALPILPRKK
ncbi:MAG: aspartate kinase [Saprospiraceae bacterium]|nr:aspartate kinase [Saprospiraceae bacterium]